MIVLYKYVICDYYWYYYLQMALVLRSKGILSGRVVAYPFTYSLLQVQFEQV